MKAERFTISVAFLLFAACGEKADDPNTRTGTPAKPRGAFLLTTGLPQARLEGTQPPIMLPLRTPGCGLSISGRGSGSEL